MSILECREPDHDAGGENSLLSTLESKVPEGFTLVLSPKLGMGNGNQSIIPLEPYTYYFLMASSTAYLTRVACPVDRSQGLSCGPPITLEYDTSPLSFLNWSKWAST